jgi:hypothetical protein
VPCCSLATSGDGTSTTFAGTHTLFDTNLALDGTLGADLTGDFGPRFQGTLALADGGNDIVLTVVPEPGSTMLLLAGFGLFASRRKRRSK